MDATSTAGSRELAEYIALLKRRWWVVGAAAALGVGLAALLVAVLPKTYSSFAIVNVTPTRIDSGSQSGRNIDVNMQTESQRVRSYVVADRVAKALGTDQSPTDLAATVQITVPDNSTIMYITVEASTPKGARDRAHAFAEAYLEARRENATSAMVAEMTSLEKQVDSLSKQLTSLTDKLQRQLVVAQMQSLNGRLSDLRVQTSGVSPGEIITDARVPTSPVNPSLSKYVPSGLVGGLLLGVVLAIWLDRTDKRVRSAEDVERVLDLPVLLDIPAKHGDGALGLLPARSRGGQSFHELCHSLAATLGHGNHVLLVAGASPGSGAGAVSANIAAGLARTGSNVLLLCADLHSTVAGDLLGQRRGAGLAEVLLGKAKIADVVRKNSMLPSLAVISTGAENDAAVEKLQSEQMSTLVAYLRKKARFTIIHAPSTSLGADAQAIANLADAALLVVETPRTRYDQIRDGIRQVHRMGAAVLGAVVLPEQTESSVGTAEPPTLTRMSVEESDKHVMGGSQSPRQVGNGAPSGDRKVADGSGGGSVPAQVAAQEDQTGHQIPWS